MGQYEGHSAIYADGKVEFNHTKGSDSNAYSRISGSLLFTMYNEYDGTASLYIKGQRYIWKDSDGTSTLSNMSLEDICKLCNEVIPNSSKMDFDELSFLDVTIGRDTQSFSLHNPETW